MAGRRAFSWKDAFQRPDVRRIWCGKCVSRCWESLLLVPSSNVLVCFLACNPVQQHHQTSINP